jgi:hypothetical protein
MSIAERYDTDISVVVFRPTKHVGGQSEQTQEYDHSTHYISVYLQDNGVYVDFLFFIIEIDQDTKYARPLCLLYT